MLQQLVWFLHMACALCIIVLILLQHGKGAEMGASFGSGASQTIFGSQGTGSFLTRLTTVFALLFAITSISLSFFVNKKTGAKTISEIILQEEKQNNQQFYNDIPMSNPSNDNDSANNSVNNKDIPELTTLD